MSSGDNIKLQSQTCTAKIAEHQSDTGQKELLVTVGEHELWPHALQRNTCYVHAFRIIVKFDLGVL